MALVLSSLHFRLDFGLLLLSSVGLFSFDTHSPSFRLTFGSLYSLLFDSILSLPFLSYWPQFWPFLSSPQSLKSCDFKGLNSIFYIYIYILPKWKIAKWHMEVHVKEEGIHIFTLQHLKVSSMDQICQCKIVTLLVKNLLTVLDGYYLLAYCLSIISYFIVNSIDKKKILMVL